MLRPGGMVPALLAAALLAAPAPAGEARTELEAVAVRIERLKVRRLAGEDVADELEKDAKK